MTKVTVYRFQVWDQTMGQNVRTPRYATLETIKRVNGLPDTATAIEVDASELDGNGFYPPKPPRS